MIPNWRKQYMDPERDEQLGLVSGVDTQVEPDMTVQAYKDDSDINVMLRRFGITGTLPAARVAPFYGDFSMATTYQEALNLIIDAETAFDELPSRIRNRFKNDPAELIAFLEDETNRPEAEALGLVTPRPPDPAQIPIVEPPE